MYVMFVKKKSMLLQIPNLPKYYYYSESWRTHFETFRILGCQFDFSDFSLA